MTDAVRDIEQIQSYLAGRLSEEDELLFQDRLARDPSLVRELEQSLTMREGLRQLRAQGYFADRTSRPASRPARSLGWLLPLAAAAVVAVVCINVWSERASVLSATPTGREAVLGHLTFLSMRSDERPKLELPARGLIEVLASPGMLSAQTYRITLIREQEPTAQSIGAAKHVAVGADGYLHSYANASRLAPGNYRLRIEPEEPGGHATEEFLFTFLATR